MAQLPAEVVRLLEVAASHPLGEAPLYDGHLESVAVLYQVHPATVDQLRAYITHPAGRAEAAKILERRRTALAAAGSLPGPQVSPAASPPRGAVNRASPGGRQAAGGAKGAGSGRGADTLQRMLERVSKAKSAAGLLGVQGTAEHIARRLLSAARGGKSRRLFLIVLSEPRPSPQAAAARTHTFRFASRGDLEAMAKDPTSGVHAWDLEAFAHGCRCLLQLDGERLVGYTWVSSSPLIEVMWGLHLNLPEDMVYNYNGFTAPAYRGTSFQGLRHLKVLERMREEGKRRLFAYVDDLNYRSLRGVEKSGYHRVGVLVGVKRRGQTHFSLTIDPQAWSEQVRMGPRQIQVASAASKIVQ